MTSHIIPAVLIGQCQITGIPAILIGCWQIIPAILIGCWQIIPAILIGCWQIIPAILIALPVRLLLVVQKFWYVEKGVVTITAAVALKHTTLLFS